MCFWHFSTIYLGQSCQKHIQKWIVQKHLHEDWHCRHQNRSLPTSVLKAGALLGSQLPNLTKWRSSPWGKVGSQLEISDRKAIICAMMAVSSSKKMVAYKYLCHLWMTHTGDPQNFLPGTHGDSRMPARLWAGSNHSARTVRSTSPLALQIPCRLHGVIPATQDTQCNGGQAAVELAGQTQIQIDSSLHAKTRRRR